MSRKDTIPCPHCSATNDVEIDLYEIGDHELRHQSEDCSECGEPFVFAVQASFTRFAEKINFARQGGDDPGADGGERFKAHKRNIMERTDDGWVTFMVCPGENKAQRIATALQERDRLRAALERIERWKFPETGKFWESPDGTPTDRPMSYSAAYGSNGERDYMRSVARTALASKEPGNG